MSNYVQYKYKECGARGVTVIGGSDTKSRRRGFKEGKSESQNRIEEEPRRGGKEPRPCRSITYMTTSSTKWTKQCTRGANTDAEEWGFGADTRTLKKRTIPESNERKRRKEKEHFAKVLIVNKTTLISYNVHMPYT